MASVSEKTFGQKYTKAQEIVEYLKVLTGYAPDNPELTPTALETFLVDVDKANGKVASVHDLLQASRSERLELYYGDDGLMERCCKLRDYVSTISPNGRESRVYVSLQKSIQRMRNYKAPRKVPVQPAVPDVEKERRISTSEKSFGSVLGVAKDILQRLANIDNYSPTNALFSIQGVTSFIESVDAKNSEVASRLADYTDAVAVRYDIYEELQLKLNQVKDVVSSLYGKKSSEYKGLLQIRF